MKTTAQTYWDMKAAVYAFMVETYKIEKHLCRELIASSCNNAFMLATEEPDYIDPYKTGDFTNVAELFMGSIEGNIEERFDEFADLPGIVAAVAKKRSDRVKTTEIKMMVSAKKVVIYRVDFENTEELIAWFLDNLFGKPGYASKVVGTTLLYWNKK